MGTRTLPGDTDTESPASTRPRGLLTLRGGPCAAGGGESMSTRVWLSLCAHPPSGHRGHRNTQPVPGGCSAPQERTGGVWQGSGGADLGVLPLCSPPHGAGDALTG